MNKKKNKGNNALHSVLVLNICLLFYRILTAHLDRMKVSKESRSSWLFLIKRILPHLANESATAYHWQKSTIRTVLKHALFSLMVCEYV